jgi:hypothetical protein
VRLIDDGCHLSAPQVDRQSLPQTPTASPAKIKYKAELNPPIYQHRGTGILSLQIKRS